MNDLVDACEKLGSWMSAALDDPKVCDAMKADIRNWFIALAATKNAVFVHIRQVERAPFVLDEDTP